MSATNLLHFMPKADPPPAEIYTNIKLVYIRAINLPRI